MGMNKSLEEIMIGAKWNPNSLFNVFNYFYIEIWSCVKLEDMLEVLFKPIPEILLE